VCAAEVDENFRIAGKPQQEAQLILWFNPSFSVSHRQLSATKEKS
jgi:hypothetical protein